MKHKAKNWTKTELQVYILLMCANADKEETKKGTQHDILEGR